jgi:hypothetical protein
MKIAFYGSSLLSSYWNGAATYYRGLLRDLPARATTSPSTSPTPSTGSSTATSTRPTGPVGRLPATPEALRRVLAEARAADIVVKASGVGVFDDELLEGVARAQRAPTRCASSGTSTRRDAGRDARDAPTTRCAAPAELDLVLTYGGGPPVVDAYEGFGARALRADLQRARSRHPPSGAARPALRRRPRLPRQPPARPRGAGGGVLPARRRALPGAQLPDRRQRLGRQGDAGQRAPPRPRLHHEHNAFNCTPLAVLNVARDSMANVGFSPATRVFEAAGAAPA